ncbi:hypothetical protein JI58_03085 [Marinosulfonomonas sp. PRT-SC04]|nr:hypothetical protein JI58_03085 [Marinosulfonomonas sp. PRT-SC04]
MVFLYFSRSVAALFAVMTRVLCHLNGASNCAPHWATLHRSDKVILAKKSAYLKNADLSQVAIHIRSAHMRLIGLTLMLGLGACDMGPLGNPLT